MTTLPKLTDQEREDYEAALRILGMWQGQRAALYKSRKATRDEVDGIYDGIIASAQRSVDRIIECARLREENERLTKALKAWGFTIDKLGERIGEK
jgi:hypothetical protein